MVNENCEMYNEAFNQWNNDLLIRFLDLEASYEQVRLSKDDTRVFARILAYMHNLARLGVTTSHISDRFSFLEKRYTTWKSIIQYEGVTYNRECNEVAADDMVWDSICEEFELGKIYRRDGNEHMWEELHGIFGPDSVRAERHAQITPFKSPGAKRIKNDDEIPDIANGAGAMDFWSYANSKEDDKNISVAPECRFPKGQYCPYPGEWIFKNTDAPTGSSSKRNKDDKVIKSKRNLNF